MIADKLRKAILQAAIQGKLTQQLSEDGNAKDLVEAIKKEKEKLIEKKIIKKQKALPPIKEDEIPFKIPENWCWVRLGEIINLISGQDLTKDNYNDNYNGIPYITGASNFNNERIIINRWTKHPQSIAFKDNILLTCKGTIETLAILKEEKVHIARQIMAINVLKNNNLFILYFIKSNISYIKAMGKSIIPGINRNNILLYPLALPPLKEQNRIVKRLETIFIQLDKLKSNEENLQILNDTFPNKLKKSLLQAAIQGKLTKQLESDDSVDDLLLEIKKEKERLIEEKIIKKQKPLPPIKEDEIPFEIPDNWRWVRLGDIANLYTGNSINANDKKNKYTNLNSGYNYISTKDILINGQINYNNGIKIPFKNKFKLAKKGSILLCIEGGSAGKKIALLKEDVCFVNKLCSIKSIIINEYYLYYFLQSPLFITSFKDNMSGIIGGTSIIKLKTILVPIPPLSEQKEIIHKITVYFNNI